MSDYVHKKVVRLPFPKKILEKYNTKSPYDCEEQVEELLGDLMKQGNKNGFELEATDKGYYLDWVYYYTYGESSGDFGNSRLLTKKELEVITPYFDKLKVFYKDEDLRVVEYCYYNCSECTDYYDIVTEDTDHANLFIT